MKAYIERRFADGEPESGSQIPANMGNRKGVLFKNRADEWIFRSSENYWKQTDKDFNSITYLEETTIDSDLYQKANPTDHAEFVHHIAQEVASAIWESTGKGNSHFNQVDINHIAEICAEEIVRAKAR